MLKTLIMFMIIIMFIMTLFYLASKSSKWEISAFTSFECGFSSYFFSRFSFSIHYFIISLLFLFLDLELCVIMPFFDDLMSSKKMIMNLIIFISVVLIGLLQEWKEGNLEWKY